jgi:hypothetical protein
MLLDFNSSFADVRAKYSSKQRQWFKFGGSTQASIYWRFHEIISVAHIPRKLRKGQFFAKGQATG